MINIDKILPKVTLQFGENSETKTVKWTLEDNESGIREILLPNGTISKEKEGEFIIEKSGIYTFIGYDNAGNMKIETIKIE